MGLREVVVHSLGGMGLLLRNLLLGNPFAMLDELRPAVSLGKVISIEGIRIVWAHASGGEETGVAMTELSEQHLRKREPWQEGRGGNIQNSGTRAARINIATNIHAPYICAHTISPPHSSECPSQRLPQRPHTPVTSAF